MNSDIKQHLAKRSKGVRQWSFHAVPVVLACAIMASLPLMSRADSIAIVNAGFELPNSDTFTSTPPDPATTGWTLEGSGGGVWNITVFPAGFWETSAPEGNQVGWLAPAPSSGFAAYFQELTASLLPNTIYELSGFVGHPAGYGATKDPDTVYTVELLAGGDVLDSISGTGPESKFVKFSLTFDSTGSSFIGQALGIRLSTNQAQTAFDAISLNTLNPVPLPAAAWMGLSLLALALPAGLKRRSNRNAVLADD